MERDFSWYGLTMIVRAVDQSVFVGESIGDQEPSSSRRSISSLHLFATSFTVMTSSTWLASRFQVPALFELLISQSFIVFEIADIIAVLSVGSRSVLGRFSVGSRSVLEC